MYHKNWVWSSLNCGLHNYPNKEGGEFINRQKSTKLRIAAARFSARDVFITHFRYVIPSPWSDQLWWHLSCFKGPTLKLFLFTYHTYFMKVNMKSVRRLIGRQLFHSECSNVQWPKKKKGTYSLDYYPSSLFPIFRSDFWYVCSNRTSIYSTVPFYSSLSVSLSTRSCGSMTL